jgi:hypothetical protein
MSVKLLTSLADNGDVAARQELGRRAGKAQPQRAKGAPDPALSLSAEPAPGRLKELTLPSPLERHLSAEYANAAGDPKHAITGFNVSQRNDKLVKEHLTGYARVPEAFRRRLAAEGAELYFGKGGAVEFDGMDRLKGHQPRGYAPGMTWDKVAGVHSWTGPTDRNPRYHSVIVVCGGSGTYGSGSVNTSAHEAGHGIDASLGQVSEQPAFVKLHDAAVKRFGREMDPYYVQKKNPQGARKEFFAETFAAWANSRAAGEDIELTRHSITRAVRARPRSMDNDWDGEMFADMLGERLAAFYDKLHASTARNPRTPKATR